MKIHFSPESSVDAVDKLLSAALRDADCRSLLILAASANGWPEEQIQSRLRALRVPCIGGLFPALLFRNALYHQGVLVISLPFLLETRLVVGLDAEIGLSSLDFGFDSVPGGETLFAIVDGYAPKTSSLVEQLYFTYGLQFSYIGGGAGAIGKPGLACVISNSGLHANALVLGRAALTTSIGMAHGYEVISEPFQVTSVEGNVLREISYESAQAVYSRLVEQAEQRRSSATVDWRDFMRVANHYPLGMRRLNDKIVVRDPIAVAADGSITLVGEVFERSYLHLLCASKEQLLSAASRANEQALGNYSGRANGKLVFDCVSRFLLGGEVGFSDELAVLIDDALPTAGVLSIGEIANSGRDFLEFYNKTVVVGVL